MKIKSLIFSLCVVWVSTTAQANPHTPLQPPYTLAQRRALSDLEVIKSTMEVAYAPLSWKAEYAGWDLDREVNSAKERITELQDPTTKACQRVIRGFFNTTKDYHVGIHFYASEEASLPFRVKSANGRYFIVSVDHQRISPINFPFTVGDEVLLFGGEPVSEVIERLRVEEYGENHLPTDQAFAEKHLTCREGACGHRVPKGSVSITAIKKESDTPKRVSLQWNYVPEVIEDLPNVKLGRTFQAVSEQQFSLSTVVKNNHVFNPLMCTPYFRQFKRGCSHWQQDAHSLGVKKSFVPTLGEVVWHSNSYDFFDAYIFELQDGRRVGYVRIPHYSGEEEEMYEFCRVMRLFEEETDGLVIDQLNNYGGYLFQMYGLLSTLTTKPLNVPNSHIMLSQTEVHEAAYLLPIFNQIKTDREAVEWLGTSLSGFPMDMDFVRGGIRFFSNILTEWHEGRVYSNPLYYFGVKQIKPHFLVQYSKPILMLINSLDFSCADFAPSILQDNGRAVLLGTRTAGAGGHVISVHMPNQSGIVGYSLTGSLALRKDHTPIENLGVKPDIEYKMTETDLQENYCEYVAKIHEVLEEILEEKE